VLGLCAGLGIPAREERLGREDLANAEELFLTNSVQEVLPVAELSGRALPARATGERLRDAYRRFVEVGGA
jgi:branched-subunit amino acid aminotransferase/4-amino-4-deoxychorismate lyase